MTFPDRDEIRPTGDRIRETLFNWLMHEVPGSTCLDLFAGSGILGMEALSRGASRVIFVDQDKASIESIANNLKALQADPGTFSVKKEDAFAWITRAEAACDLVFVDPPFDDVELLYTVLNRLNDAGLARQWIYIESESQLDPDRLPADWSLHRAKRAGSVCYSLMAAAQ